MITVVTPLSRRNFSSSVLRNLSTPDDTIGSPDAGANAAGRSAALPPPPRVNATGTPAVRAAASSRLTFGIDATQRGRRCSLHVCWLKSSITSAVVLASTVTGFNAGGGGGL